MVKGNWTRVKEYIGNVGIIERIINYKHNRIMIVRIERKVLRKYHYLLICAD
jgi:hypothetical protein